MRGRNFSKDERGSATVEFAMVAGIFFMVLISIIEFSRLLYTHNALTDAARRGARYAAIHKATDETCVRNVVIYGERHVDNSCAPTGAPLVNDIDDATINIIYQGADTDYDGTIDSGYGTNLGTVTVTIENYTFDLLVPYLNLEVNMPHYTTTLSAESAGEEPDDIIPGPPPAP
jgi:Flp pilus assembly protein TadG